MEGTEQDLKISGIIYVEIFMICALIVSIIEIMSDIVTKAGFM